MFMFVGSGGEGRIDRDYTSEVSAKVAVFGVPASAGARSAGVQRAPFVLREAGLLQEMRARGARVVNLSDLSLFPYREDAAHPAARNAGVVACAVRATADEMTRALAEGFTLVLGGDCTLVSGLVGGARKALGQPVGLVYIDANADLNTPETSPSGYLNGMALSMAMGRGPAEVVDAAGPRPAVAPEHVALLGFRELDPGERPVLGDLGLALPAEAARRLGMRTVAALALDAIVNEDGPVVVHLDVDAIHPAELPTKDYVTPGQGLGLAEMADLLTALLASPRVVALEVAEFYPEVDPEGVHARAIVDLLVGALRRRLRAASERPA
jgi:arginase